MSLTGVVLAAGASRRMGRPKALVGIRGESFVAHGVRHLWTVCDVVYVVLGSGANGIRTSIEEEFERLVRAGRLHDEIQAARRHGANVEVRFVIHRAWRQGCSARRAPGWRARAEPGRSALPSTACAPAPQRWVPWCRRLGAIRARKPSARFAYGAPRFRRHRVSLALRSW